jgi:hypothetical protein
MLIHSSMASAEQHSTTIPRQAGAQPQDRYTASSSRVRQTVRGRLIVGTLEGVIESSTGTTYYFASKDRIARQLLAACGDADFCEADVMLSHEEIMRVRSARPLLKSALSDKERDEWKKHLGNE